MTTPGRCPIRADRSEHRLIDLSSKSTTVAPVLSAVRIYRHPVTDRDLLPGLGFGDRVTGYWDGYGT